MKSRRALLIDPPLYKHPLWDPIRTSQPLGIWSIGSYLQACGHEVRLVCAPLEGLENAELVDDTGRVPRADLVERRAGLLDRMSNEDLISQLAESAAYIRVGLTEARILREIDEFQPDVVGISAIASCLHQSVVDLAVSIRAANPEVVIVAGGQHATAMSEVLLRSARGAIDLVVCGEGEIAVEEVLGLLPDLDRVRDIPGIAYIAPDGGFVSNQRPRPINLASLAPLNPSLLQHVRLPQLPAHTYGDRPLKTTDMMFSVGCHRACPYCFSPVMRGKLRTLSFDRIRAQLSLLRDHGYEEVVLQDDDLLKDRDFFTGLLRLIRETGLTWQDNGGMELELFDDALVDEIIESGCRSIYVPVNPRQIADRLPCAEAVSRVPYLARLRSAGIYTFTSGIYGVPNLEHPDQTYDDLRRLRDFHLEIVALGHVDASLVFPLSALPGTRWFREVERSTGFRFDRSDWVGYSIFVPQVFVAELDKELLCRELLETHRALNEIQDSYPWFSPFPNRSSKSFEESNSVGRALLEATA